MAGPPVAPQTTRANFIVQKALAGMSVADIKLALDATPVVTEIEEKLIDEAVKHVGLGNSYSGAAAGAGGPDTVVGAGAPASGAGSGSGRSASSVATTLAPIKPPGNDRALTEAEKAEKKRAEVKDKVRALTKDLSVADPSVANAIKQNPFYWLALAHERLQTTPVASDLQTDGQILDNATIKQLLEETEIRFNQDIYGNKVYHTPEMMIFDSRFVDREPNLAQKETHPARFEGMALAVMQAAYDLIDMGSQRGNDYSEYKVQISNLYLAVRRDFRTHPTTPETQKTRMQAFTNEVMGILLKDKVLAGDLGKDIKIEKSMPILYQMARNHFGYKTNVVLGKADTWEVHNPIRSEGFRVNPKSKHKALLEKFMGLDGVETGIIPTQVLEGDLNGALRYATSVDLGHGLEKDVGLSRSGSPGGSKSALSSENLGILNKAAQEADYTSAAIMDLVTKQEVSPSHPGRLFRKGERGRYEGNKKGAKEQGMPHNYTPIYEYDKDDASSETISRVVAHLAKKQETLGPADALNKVLGFLLKPISKKPLDEFTSRVQQLIDIKKTLHDLDSSHPDKKLLQAYLQWKILEINKQAGYGVLTTVLGRAAGVKAPAYHQWQAALTTFMEDELHVRENLQCKSGKDRTGLVLFMTQVLAKSYALTGDLLTDDLEKFNQAKAMAVQAPIVNLNGHMATTSCYGVMADKVKRVDTLTEVACHSIKKEFQAFSSNHAVKARKIGAFLSFKAGKGAAASSGSDSASDYSSSDSGSRSPSSPHDSLVFGRSSSVDSTHSHSSGAGGVEESKGAEPS